MEIERKLAIQPLSSHRFVVEIGGVAEGAFTECTLPAVEWDLKELKEGGLTGYTHLLPGSRKGAKLSLKKGVCKHGLINWLLEGLKGTPSRKKLTVQLLDGKLKPVLRWETENAFPYKWSGPSLQSGSSTAAIHTLEFVCGEINIEYF